MQPNSPLWTLLSLSCLVVTAPAVTAQSETDGVVPVSLSLGGIRTEADRSAFRIAVHAEKPLSASDLQGNFENGIVYLAPEIRIETGEADAFSAIITKVTGSLLFFTTTQVGGVETPNTRFFHAIPISIGAETEGRFETVNVLAEAGYVPWFQGSVPGQWKKLRVGMFLQGGYKFPLDPAADPPVPGEPSGSMDESAENPKSALLRANASARFSPELIVWRATGLGLGVRTDGDVWYDIANAGFYHSFEGAFRIRFGKDRYVELIYQKGSGPPNFNKGRQFGANITLTF